MNGWYYPSQLFMQVESVPTFIFKRLEALYLSICTISHWNTVGNSSDPIQIPQMERPSASRIWKGCNVHAAKCIGFHMYIDPSS